MPKYVKVFLVLILMAVVALPLWAEETNNSNSVNSFDKIKFFKSRPIFFNQAILKTIDGQILTVTVKDKVYAVSVSDKTKLLRKYGAKSNLAEFKVGHKLQVYGKRTAELTMSASLIRNSSIEKKRGTFLGVIESLDLANQKFVLKPTNRAKVTVTVSAATKIIYKSKTLSFADLAVGSKLAVAGVWDKSDNTVTEVSKIVTISQTQ
jgi:hypothetical protein